MNPFQKSKVLKYLLPLAILLFQGTGLRAQKMALSTNIADYVNLFTLNGAISCAASQNMTLELSARYNPFVYERSGSDRQFQNKRISVYAGTRYWPWHVYSGWFVSGYIGFTRFNTGGLFSQKTYEGDAYGLSFGGGYALMLSPRFNMDFALSFMAGDGKYRRNSCPSYGSVDAVKKQVFIAADNIVVQLSYLF